MTDETRHPRSVSPRRWAVAALAGVAIAQPALTTMLMPTKALASSSATESGEGGESGESGVVLTEGPTRLLTQLGYFEGTYRIASELYLSGKRDQARAHLEESHHAFYDDVAPMLAEYGAPGFEDKADAFTAAIANDASDDAVIAARDAVYAALDAAGSGSGATDFQRLMALHDLMSLAAAEYDGGVADGAVDIAIEYRDSWGFYSTAKARAEAMAEATDPAVAAAARDILSRLDGLDALYPSLDAETTGAASEPLHAAAGWVEIIALRVK